MKDRRPSIGVFDSGVGGLTVLRALIEHLPDADYMYFGDTARLPYGSKSAATVAHYAVGAIEYLQARGVDMLVIACNTATALAFPEILKRSHVAVIGVIEPGADAAANASAKREVVVIGTDATVNSHAYQRALEARQTSVREKACPLFVPLVEEGWVEHPVTEQVARIYLAEAFAGDFQDADVLLLGCTHYPLIKPLLRKVAPPHIAIVDSADSTARAVAIQLGAEGGGDREQSLTHVTAIQAKRGNLPEKRSHTRLKFFATDSVEKFKKLGTRFLGYPVEDVEHVDLKE